MSPHLAWLSIGSFVLKSSPSGFGILLTHSSRRRSNAPWEHSSERNENRGNGARLGRYGAQRRGYSMRIVVTCVRAVICTVLVQG